MSDDVHEGLLAEYRDEPTAQVVRDLALATLEPTDVSVDTPQARVIPTGARLHITDPTAFDRIRATPRRTSGSVGPQTLDALIAYVKEHHNDASTVWLDQESGRTVAVLNDHQGLGDAGWGDHRATFAPRKTPEWMRWTGADGQWYEQEAFANLIEDGLTEIASPDGGVLLDVVQTLTGHVNVTWENATRLSDGRLRAQYVEDVGAKAGEKGDLEVPTDFALVLPVFHGEEAVRLDAKLRWRLRSGKVTFAFKLDNPHRAVQDSIDLMHARLAGEFPRVYAGQPR